MRIPLPCPLGQNGLTAVSWFHWTTAGWEFTYIISGKIRNLTADRTAGFPEFLKITDCLMADGPFSDRGYPLKGKGHVSGITIRDGQLYADAVLTDLYYQHILIPCDAHGMFQPEHRIIWPPVPSLDSAEKRKMELLKKYHETIFY